MFDIGFAELLVCAIVALLVLGPERLPGAVRTVGRWVGRARHTVNHFTEQIDRELRAEELKRRIEEEMKKAGVDDVARQVNEALRTPLPLVGGEYLRENIAAADNDAPANSILPPARSDAAPALLQQAPAAVPAPAVVPPASEATAGTAVPAMAVPVAVAPATLPAASAPAGNLDDKPQ